MKRLALLLSMLGVATSVHPTATYGQAAPRIGTFNPHSEGCSDVYWLARGGSDERVVLDAMKRRMRINGQMVALQDVSDDYNERTRRTVSVYAVPSLGARIVLRAQSRSTGEESHTSTGTLAVTIRGRTTTVRVRGEGGC